jgi:hypothetical protein
MNKKRCFVTSVLFVFIVSTSCLQAQPGRGIVGVQIKKEAGEVLVQKVFPDSPAQEAGLKPGDRILKIDGVLTKTLTIGQISGQISGKAGTRVHLTLLRSQKGEKSFEIVLIRKAISGNPARQRIEGDYIPTKYAHSVEWKGDRIKSRVLPYNSFVSTFIRLPIAHAAATGKGVCIDIMALPKTTPDTEFIKHIAPEAKVRHIKFHSTVKIPDDSLILVIPDVTEWNPDDLLGLADRVKGKQLLVIPSDLSENDKDIRLINQLHADGSLTVGRLDRQSTTFQSQVGGDQKTAFNKRIREIHTDVFCAPKLKGEVTWESAAVAGGVAALVYEKYPDVTPEEIRQRIVDGARNIWQATSIQNGKWKTNFTIDPVTSQYTPNKEQAVFRFRALDAAGAVGVDTEIPWYLNMLNCQKAWEITRGQNTTIAVTDQGFHIRHPELKDKIKDKKTFGPKQFGGNFQNFHGTDMSRIALSIAPEAGFVPLLCSGPRDQLPEKIAQSFIYASHIKADVITSSWSGRFNKDKVLIDAIDQAVEQGVVVSWFHYPHEHPGILRTTFTYAWWQQDKGIAVLDRFCPDKPGFHPAEIEAGLSPTAPQAAGLVALIKSVNKDLTPAQIEQIIYKNCDPISKNLWVPDAYKIVLAAKGEK